MSLIYHYLKFESGSLRALEHKFYAFAVVFPDKQSLSKRDKLTISIPTIVLGTLLLIPQFLTREILQTAYGNTVIVGVPGYVLFVAVFLGFFGGGLYRIARGIPKATGVLKYSFDISSGACS